MGNGTSAMISMIPTVVTLKVIDKVIPVGWKKPRKKRKKKRR